MAVKSRKAAGTTMRKVKRVSKPKAVKQLPKRTPKKTIRRTKRITKKSQTGSYRRVWNGTAKYTKGGLTKDQLCLNKRGKVVSKKKYNNSKRSSFGIKKWLVALKK